MRKFNPDEHQGDDRKTLQTAGEFMAVVRSIKWDRNKNGKEYILARCEVIHGPCSGQSWFERFYTNDASLWKLGKLCSAMRYKGEFDLDSKRDVAKVLMARPFLCEVVLRSDGNRKHPEVKGFITDPVPNAVKKMDAWRDEWEQGRNPDEDEFSDDDGGSGGSASDFADDDIPF